MSTMYEVPEIDAAVDQLDWAIRLFLDSSAYVPATTLAGAADGILEALLKINPMQETAYVSIKKSLTDKRAASADDIGRYMNGPRNFLKHADGSAFDNKQADLQTIAIHQIIRCMTNLLRIDRSLSCESPRFYAWLKANRPDLSESQAGPGATEVTDVRCPLPPPAFPAKRGQ